MFVVTCAEVSFSKALIIYAELLFWLLRIILSLPWVPETQNTHAVNFYPYSVLINLIGVLRKVTKNGTLWLHLSAPVYFPNYLFSSLPYINFYCFQPSHAPAGEQALLCSLTLHPPSVKLPAGSLLPLMAIQPGSSWLLMPYLRRCYSPRFWVNHLSR